MLARLASGELSLVVGTHALIEPASRSRALALAVVDEQHRFGVRQRTALSERPGAVPPHTLHMTATPIPARSRWPATATSTRPCCASCPPGASRCARSWSSASGSGPRL